MIQCPFKNLYKENGHYIKGKKIDKAYNQCNIGQNYKISQNMKGCFMKY